MLQHPPAWNEAMLSRSGKVTAFAACLVALSGCATTSTYDYINPRFAQAHYSGVSVFVNSYDLGLRKRLEGAQCEALKPTPCLPLGEVIFPGEEQDMDHILTVLKSRGIPALLVLEIKQDQASSRVAGFIGSSNTESYGSASGSGSWNSTSTPYGSGVSTVGNYAGHTSAHVSSNTTSFSAPIMAYDRKSKGTVELVDVNTRDTAWRGQIDTTGQGIFAVTDGSFVHAQTKGVAQHLNESGLIVARK